VIGSERHLLVHSRVILIFLKMLLLPKEIWDEVAVQSLKQDAENVFTKSKFGTSFEELIVAHKYNEANRLWCVRQFAILHLPSLIKKAHSIDLNKWWFVDFIQDRRIKFKNPMANIFCSELVDHLRLGTSRDWFHNLWDKALDEWIMEQPKEENVLLRVQSNHFLTNLEEFCVHRPDYINWVNPYSLWVSEKISIPLLSIDSFKMWLSQERIFYQQSYPWGLLLNVPHERIVYVKTRYALGVENHFAFVHNKPPLKKSSGYNDMKVNYDVMWEMMDIFWGEDQKLPVEQQLFEISPCHHVGNFDPEDFYADSDDE
jgi:hypothetical protein